MKKVLVTGANGQLGKCIHKIAYKYPNLVFEYRDRLSLDIVNNEQVAQEFALHKYDYCINTAAYTKVDAAESNQEKAYNVNVLGAKHIAEACDKNNVTLLHVSTDYVFDGTTSGSYCETDSTNPINVYGITKRDGELEISSRCLKHYIVRTSWLYSEFEPNFYTTILHAAKTGRNLNITTEQTGTPTQAIDLAEVLIQFIIKDAVPYGIYHFSNKGATTWYDFAGEIIKQNNLSNQYTIGKTDHYPTPAKRPKRSVLCTDKIEKTLQIIPSNWEKKVLPKGE